MVRNKNDGQIYAMKILKKQMVLQRRQYEHTLSEVRRRAASALSGAYCNGSVREG